LLAADEDDLLALHGVGPRAIRILREEAQDRRKQSVLDATLLPRR
jgi:hypothetical protein